MALRLHYTVFFVHFWLCLPFDKEAGPSSAFRKRYGHLRQLVFTDGTRGGGVGEDKRGSVFNLGNFKAGHFHLISD